MGQIYLQLNQYWNNAYKKFIQISAEPLCRYIYFGLRVTILLFYLVDFEVIGNVSS